jgi:hypothetical protein
VKTLKKIAAPVVLVFALWLPVIAGEIGTGGIIATPPPACAETNTCANATASATAELTTDADSDLVGLLNFILGLF